MQTNLLWSGREYYSLENCLVNTIDSGSEITSVIVGTYQGMIYRVDYRVKTNKYWQVLFAEAKAQHTNHRYHFEFEALGDGKWLCNGKPEDRFDGCIDVDIPLTPFTNSLPINRLNLRPGEEQTIKVVYIDLLANMITPVKQKYHCRSKTKYHYENVPNDFEATIEVDEKGFVIDYPLLFERKISLVTHYS
jgi:hypothetical protein